MLVGKTLATNLRLWVIQAFPIKVRTVEKDEVDDWSCRCMSKPRQPNYSSLMPVLALGCAQGSIHYSNINHILVN